MGLTKVESNVVVQITFRFSNTNVIHEFQWSTENFSKLNQKTSRELLTFSNEINFHANWPNTDNWLMWLTAKQSKRWSTREEFKIRIFLLNRASFYGWNKLLYYIILARFVLLGICVYEAYTVNHTQKDTKRMKLPHFFDLGH